MVIYCEIGREIVIETKNERPPIPDRRHDWVAWVSPFDLGADIATGATEGEAIANLIEQIED